MFKMCDYYMMWPEVDTHQEYETLLKLIKNYNASKVSKGDDAPCISLIDEFKDEGVSVEVNDAGRKLLESWFEELNKDGAACN